jgi:hypothetical protein
MSTVLQRLQSLLPPERLLVRPEQLAADVEVKRGGNSNQPNSKEPHA